MKNLLIAFGISTILLRLLNCHRSTTTTTNTSSRIVGIRDTVVREDIYKVGDTIRFTYKESPMIYDTMYYQLSSEKTLEFLSEEERNPSAELMVMRMDISEMENKTEHIYSFLAKKKGTAYFSIINELKSGSPKATIPKSQITWKVVVE